MPIEVITNENGSYVDVEDLEKVDVPEPNTNEVTEQVEEEPSNAWAWWFFALIVISLVLVGIAITNR